MNTTAAPILTEEYRRLPLEQIQESKTNPRRHFDKVADAELAASIKSKGVVEPIICRPHPSGKDFEIVAGTRRYRQSKVAGKPDIPAVIRNYADAEAMEVQIIENLQRKDVHPMDEAFGFQQLLAQRDDKKRPLYDVPAIAGKVGKSVSYVYMRLKLMDLVDKAQEALWEDQITAGHAEKIARLQPKQQAEALKQCTAYDVSVRDLAEWIERTVHLDLVKAPFDPKDAALVPAAKACITCPKRAGTQPDLFADITKADTCTDPGCFNAKVNAHYAQRKSALAKEGLKVIEATSHSYSGKKAIVPVQQLTRAGNIKCDDLGAALIVEGNDRGDDIRICTNPKCKKHHPPAARQKKSNVASSRHNDSQSPPKIDYREQAAQFAQAKALIAMVDGFRKKPVLGLTELQFLAKDQLGCGINDDVLSVICQRFGAEVPKTGFRPIDRAAEKSIANTKTPAQATQWLFAATTGRAMADGHHDVLRALAKRFGIDLPKLQAKILGELKAKDKALAVAAKKAKAAKLQTSAKPKKKAATTGAKRKPKGKKRG